MVDDTRNGGSIHGFSGICRSCGKRGHKERQCYSNGGRWTKGNNKSENLLSAELSRITEELSGVRDAKKEARLEDDGKSKEERELEKEESRVENILETIGPLWHEHFGDVDVGKGRIILKQDIKGENEQGIRFALFLIALLVLFAASVPVAAIALIFGGVPLIWGAWLIFKLFRFLFSKFSLRVFRGCCVMFAAKVYGGTLVHLPCIYLDVIRMSMKLEFFGCLWFMQFLTFYFYWESLTWFDVGIPTLITSVALGCWGVFYVDVDIAPYTVNILGPVNWDWDWLLSGSTLINATWCWFVGSLPTVQRKYYWEHELSFTSFDPTINLRDDVRTTEVAHIKIKTPEWRAGYNVKSHKVCEVRHNGMGWITSKLLSKFSGGLAHDHNYVSSLGLFFETAHSDIYTTDQDDELFRARVAGRFRSKVDVNINKAGNIVKDIFNGTTMLCLLWWNNQKFYHSKQGFL